MFEEKQSMSQPKVSVIIPVYNTEKYLRECLDSVVNQTLKDIEIICVDDGSSDGSPCILEEYRAKDSRVVAITQANLGPSSARNSGMNRAHGEYIAFVDSDDYLELNTLESVSRIAAEKHLDVILFDVEPFYESEQLAQNSPVHYKNISESTEIMSGVQYLKTSKD
jgi:glycosyltransferase involved in cell wall biosynthesis